MQDPQAAAPADRAAHHEAMAKMRDEHMAARSAALKDLYAVLTPEQKALADQRLRGRHGHRMAMRAPGALRTAARIGPRLVERGATVARGREAHHPGARSALLALAHGVRSRRR